MKKNVLAPVSKPTKILSWTLIYLLSVNPFIHAVAQGIHVDGNATVNNRATLEAAANGVPVVNIANPSAKGISHNKFEHFNVGVHGVVINNSRQISSTQLAGFIAGNGNLSNSANIILNEVTHANPSQLLGYTEIAGHSARYILANPYGITCKGCGFINTPHSTLTTGTPNFLNGDLTGFSVDGGQVAIEGLGLNANSVDRFDIFARAVALNASGHAKNLNIVTGRNDVDFNTSGLSDADIQAKADNGSTKPTFALDASALGSLNANQIFLIGTEQGVGVNMLSNVAADAGNIQISADGKLTLGSVRANGDVALTSQNGDIALNGTSYGENLNLSANGTLTTAAGSLTAARNQTRVTATNLQQNGTLAGGVNQDNSLNTEGDLTLTITGVLNNAGRQLAGDQLNLSASTLNNASGGIIRGKNTALILDGAVNQGGLSAEAQLSITARRDIDNHQGSLAAATTIINSEGDFSNNDGVIEADQLSLNVAGTLTNRAGIISQRGRSNQTLTVGALDNTDGKLQSAADNLTIAVAGALTNMDSNGDSRVSDGAGGTTDDSQGELLHVGSGTLTVVAGSLTNLQGNIASNNDVNVNTTTTLNNDSGTIAGDTVTLRATSINNQSGGAVRAQETLTANAVRGDLDNRGGSLLALGTLGTTQLDAAGSINNAGGLIQANTAQLTLNGGAVTNSNAGRILHAGTGQLQLRSSGRTDNSTGTLATNGNLQLITSGDLDNNGGTLRSVLGLQADVGRLINGTGLLQSLGGNVLLTADNAISNAATGRVLSAADLLINAGSLTTDGLIQAANTLNLTLPSLTTATNSDLRAGSVLVVNAADFTNQAGGSVTANALLDFNLTGDFINNGLLSTSNDLQVDARNLTNSGTLSVGGSGDFSLTGIASNSGRWSTMNDFNLTANRLDNSAALGSGRNLLLSVGTINNTAGGAIFAAGSTDIFGQTLNNTEADIYSIGDLRFAANAVNGLASSLNNVSGSIESQSTIRLFSDSLVNRKRVFSFSPSTKISGDITFICHDCSGDHYDLSYNNREIFESTITENSSQARLLAGVDLFINTDNVSNQHSLLAANRNVVINTRTLLNQGAQAGSLIRTTTYRSGRITDGTHGRTVPFITAYNNASGLTAVPAQIVSYVMSNVVETPLSGAISVDSTIQAGGNLTINASAGITNTNGTTTQNAELQTLTGSLGSTTTTAGSALDGNNGMMVDGVPGTGQPLGLQIMNPLNSVNFKLPQSNGLFVINANPGRDFIVETNPAFANFSSFIGSNYLLSRLNYTPDSNVRRLGDSFYESRLVREAIVSATGSRYLASNFTNEGEQFRHLLDNALVSQSALGLSVGVGLTAAQVAALTHDIVWLQEQTVTLPDGQQIQALVPVLYLASVRSGQIKNHGALLAGNDINLITNGSLANSGAVKANNKLSVSAEQNIVNLGTLKAGNVIQLTAGNSLLNSGSGYQDAIINGGGDVSLVAANGDIRSERTVRSFSRAGRSGSREDGSYQIDLLGADARIEGNNVSLSAGRDITLAATEVNANDNFALNSGRDVVINSVEKRTDYSIVRRKNRVIQEKSEHTGSVLTAGGDITVQAGNDLRVQGSNLTAPGQANLQAAGDVTLEASADRQYNEYYKKSSRRKTLSINETLTHKASELVSAANINIRSGDDLTVKGSNLNAGADINLAAVGDTNIESVQDEHYAYFYTKKKGSFGRKKSIESSEETVSNNGSLIAAAGNVTINSSLNVAEGENSGGITVSDSQRVSVVGSNIKAGRDLVVYAGEDVTLDAGTESYAYSFKKKKSGFAGLSKSSTHKIQNRKTTLGTELSAGNDVVIVSGTDTNVLASKVAADDNIQINAGTNSSTNAGTKGDGDINLLAGHNSYYRFYEVKESKTGLSFTSDSISFGNKEKAGQRSTGITNVASELYAGGDVDLSASRDINVVGSEVAVDNDLRLTSRRDVNLLAGVDDHDEKTWQEKSQIGISWNSDENGVNMFVGKESVEQSIRHRTELSAGSQLQAGNGVNINAGRNINQLGGEVNAGRDIVYTAKNDIKLVADTDKLTSEEHYAETKSGLGISIQHNYGKTKDAVEGAGEGEDGVSKTSSTLNAIDSVSQFAAGPTASSSLGRSKTESTVTETQGIAQGSQLNAGRDIRLTADKDLTLEGTKALAGRDIVLGGENVRVTAAGSSLVRESETNNHWAGIRHQGRSIGLGVSVGTDILDLEADRVSAASLQAGQDLRIDAVNDIRLKGIDATAQGDINLNAGNKLTIGAHKGDYNEVHDGQQAGGEFGITVFENGSTIGFYGEVSGGQNDLAREAGSYRNSHLNARDKLNTRSGSDTHIAGATLEAYHLNVDVGGDLTVSSLQDTSEVEGERWDGSVRVTVGAGVSVSGSAGYGETEGEKAWVAEQTRLIGRESVIINTDDHTLIDGALIANIDENGQDQGNLSLSTGTLAYNDLHDKHTETSEYTRISGSWEGEGAAQDRGPNNAYTQGSDNPRGDETGPDLDSRTTWGIEGSYSNLDREQINRATVGKGEITVRGDSEGEDSTVGLNRNVATAQQLTKDEESHTELYVTETAVEDAVGLFMDDDPSTAKNEDTLERWAENLDVYGRNATRQFIQMGEVAKALSDRDEAVAQFAGAVATAMNETLDTLAKFTLGITPSIENHGGLVTQLPALVFGDQLNNVVEIKLKREIDQNGKAQYSIAKYTVAGKDIDLDILPADVKYAFVNGIQNSLKEAARNGAMQTGTDKLLVAYNPGHGLLADLIESGWDTSVGEVFPSGNARQVAEMWAYFAKNKIKMKGAAHSQGGLLTMRALKWIQDGILKKPDDAKGNEGYQFQINGAPVSTAEFAVAVKRSGAEVKGPNQGHNINPGDPVPLLLGRNANKASEVLEAMLNIFNMFDSSKSPHSSYTCKGDFCDNKQPGIGAAP